MPLRRENQRMITSFMKELSEPAVDSKSIPRKKTAGSVGSFMSVRSEFCRLFLAVIINKRISENPV